MMFENFSHLVLQQYWWIIVSLLGSLLVFLLFVQGGQTLIYRLGKNETERTLLINVLGRKWEFTFTTLVTFGGAFFASFPLFYSTSFGGAYWVWMIILFAFVIQAVSYEYRRKPANFLGHRTFETFLFINGALGTILLGTAVSTFFTGSQFSVNENNFSQWETASHGLEAALNIQNLSLGLGVFFLSRVLAVLYFFKNVSNTAIIERAKKQLIYDAVPFLVFFLAFITMLLLKKGYAVEPTTGVVSMEPYKYLHNLVQMPLVAALFLVGVVLVLMGILRTATCFIKCSDKGIWLSGFGTVLTVFSLFLLAGFNNTAFYPSTFDLQSSLTIRNSSSSHYTLTAMSYVSLLIPFVLAYIVVTWRAINKKKIDAAELEDEGHIY
jgi:cytochrome bd ubiquinol oxidase subunit II